MLKHAKKNRKMIDKHNNLQIRQEDIITTVNAIGNHKTIAKTYKYIKIYFENNPPYCFWDEEKILFLCKISFSKEEIAFDLAKDLYNKFLSPQIEAKLVGIHGPKDKFSCLKKLNINGYLNIINYILNKYHVV